MNLSVVLATFNEEENIGKCLDAVKDIADEIVVVDGSSTDKTVQIAKSKGAKVEITQNHPIFHINKQRAIDLAKGNWILQLDADEFISKSLAKEILKVTKMTEGELEEYQRHLPHRQLFLRHQQIIEVRDGKLGENSGPYVAFFLPRANYFLGKYLRYGGVYPDGVIRLIKKDKAYLPCKDVHEQMVVNGRVGWLENDLIHMSDPTFTRYLQRNNRYINLIVQELKGQNRPKNLVQMVNFLIFKPIHWFGLTFLRHKGFLDGYQGFIFSLFSALRFPKAYLRYLRSSNG